jgi:mono/diheme cytochrome c family protein
MPEGWQQAWSIPAHQVACCDGADEPGRQRLALTRDMDTLTGRYERAPFLRTTDPVCDLLWTRPRRLAMFSRSTSFISGPILATAVSLVSPLAALAADEPGRIVDAWIRPAGQAAAFEDSAASSRLRIDLASLPKTEGRRFDAQYGKYLWFEGVSLEDLLARLRPASHADLALLHFANGMVVPLPLKDRRVLDQLDPFIALRMRSAPGGRYDPEFPPLARKSTGFADVPSTHFSGNKLVVARLWHPAVSEKIQADFSPWALVDSLTAIELVQAAAYYQQFDVDPSPEAQAGLSLFRQSCQFCHGARRLGAKFGWDFVEPTPLYTYRKGPARLYFHVHFRRYDAVDRGQQMPALRSMDEADAKYLWQWLKAIGSRPMLPYTPAP